MTAHPVFHFVNANVIKQRQPEKNTTGFRSPEVQLDRAVLSLLTEQEKSFIPSSVASLDISYRLTVVLWRP